MFSSHHVCNTLIRYFFIFLIRLFCLLTAPTIRFNSERREQLSMSCHKRQQTASKIRLLRSIFTTFTPVC